MYVEMYILTCILRKISTSTIRIYFTNYYKHYYICLIPSVQYFIYGVSSAPVEHHLLCQYQVVWKTHEGNWPVKKGYLYTSIECKQWWWQIYISISSIWRQGNISPMIKPNSFIFSIYKLPDTYLHYS